MRFTILLSLLVSAAAAQTGPGFSMGNMDPHGEPVRRLSTSTPAAAGWPTIRSPPTSPCGASSTSWRSATALILRIILDKALRCQRSQRTAVEQKIGDFYASCMDEQTIDKLGIRAASKTSSIVSTPSPRNPALLRRTGAPASHRRECVVQVFLHARREGFHAYDRRRSTRAAWAFPIATIT